MNQDYYQNQLNRPTGLCGQCGQGYMNGERYCTRCGAALAISAPGAGARGGEWSGSSADPAVFPLDKDLQDYLRKATGTSRAAINVMCGVGIFIFGWLVAVPFWLMGKRSIGWLYLIPLIILFRIGVRIPEVGLAGLVLYIIAWVHANLAFSHYQQSARLRLPLLEGRAPYEVNAALEMGLLLKKVQGKTFAALDVLSKALAMPGGDPALLNQAGRVMHRSKRYYEAVEFFRRALESAGDTKLQAAIRKSFLASSRKLQKIQARTGGGANMPAR